MTTEFEIKNPEDLFEKSPARYAQSRFEAETPVTEERADQSQEQNEPDEKEAGKNENWPGDCGTLGFPLRKVLVTLLKGPYLYRDKRKEAWNLLMDNLPTVREQLANLLLDLVVDEELGVAFVKNPDMQDVQAPSLLNKYSFRFLDSVLLIEMRDRLMRAQQSGQRAMMEADEINTHLAVFDPISKTDQKIFSQHVGAVLNLSSLPNS